MHLVEAFSSIQGEGTYVGALCTFIRLAGCNLKCPFCDTKYALSPNQYKEVDASELVHLIQSFDMPYVIFTGGEPLLHQTEIIEVMKSAGFCRYKYGIESNCTVALTNIAWPLISRDKIQVRSTCPGPLVHFTLSPKLGVPDADPQQMTRIAQSVIDYCREILRDRTVELKFLVDLNVPDKWIGNQFVAIHTFLEEIHFAEGVPVILQVQTPYGKEEAETIETVRKDYVRLANFMQDRYDMGLVAFCHHKRMPLRVLPQLHVLTFGPNKRGV